MDQIFNFFGVNETVNSAILANYETTWATSTSSSTNNGIITVYGDDMLVVDKSYIDNSTKHTTTVYYNYGNISSDPSNNPYRVTAASFQSIYVSIYTENAYTWSWDEDAMADDEVSTTLIYGNTNTDLNINYILGTSKKDSRYNATGLVYNTSAGTGAYEDSIELDSTASPQATLTTNVNGLAEYFDVTIANDGTITFDPVSQDSNPMGDVPSTLTINCVDSYGHSVVITLPITVTQRL
ncbi:MAG: hypothetical protein LUC23_00110 [Prevotellaceae bacterium]|nr:hypothetical protein [Prevotellaceae bacterium]